MPELINERSSWRCRVFGHAVENVYAELNLVVVRGFWRQSGIPIGARCMRRGCEYEECVNVAVAHQRIGSMTRRRSTPDGPLD